jgi:hypothetical protein
MLEDADHDGDMDAVYFTAVEGIIAGLDAQNPRADANGNGLVQSGCPSPGMATAWAKVVWMRLSS